MKHFSRPDIEYVYYRNIIENGITPLATVSLKSIRLIGDGKKIKTVNDFYLRLSDNFKLWSSEQYPDTVLFDYENDPHPRKRFRYVPFLLVFNTDPVFIKDHILKVTISISLSKNGNNLSKREITHFWNLKNALMLPLICTKKYRSS